MSANQPLPILVAVGASDCEAALQFAVAEAVRSGSSLHLVHVVRVLQTGPEIGLATFEVLRAAGAEILATAARRAEELLADRGSVTTELAYGEPIVSGITARSKRALLVVLQRRKLSAFGRFITSSTAGGVAARAHTPVVSVPTGWTVPESPHGIITVGIDDVPSSHVTRGALELAQTRGALLRIVHAWWLPLYYDNLITERAATPDWLSKTRDQLEEWLETLNPEFPTVQVEVDVRHCRPIEALIRASEHSDLLVVGRHDPFLPLGSHLGPVARTVLQQAACPVLVIEPVKPVDRHARHDNDTSQAHPNDERPVPLVMF
jgi:nucleotide-binding universal stress UspA family protein